jgi:uncharacterized protein
MIPVGDGTLKDILSAQRTFAMVGASGDPNRPSHGVMAYLQARGFRIIPVNPALAGQELMGETVYASLADVPGPVDVVDIFRRSDAALDVVREAIAGKDRLGLKTIWMQIGVIDRGGRSARGGSDRRHEPVPQNRICAPDALTGVLPLPIGSADCITQRHPGAGRDPDTQISFHLSRNSSTPRSRTRPRGRPWRFLPRRPGTVPAPRSPVRHHRDRRDPAP